MNILVTGATGFIGSHLVEDLSQLASHDIICLVRNPKKAQKLKKLGVRLIYVDISDEASLEKISDLKIDVIFHCAGYVENKNRRLLHRTNVIGTRNICKLALKLSVEKLIHLSSVAVVSGNDQSILEENTAYCAPNIYGQSKVEAEKEVIQYRQKGLKTVIIRPCVVYGEAEPHLTRLLLKLIKFRLLPMIGNSQNKFPFVYVKNVTALMIAALDRKEYLEGSFFITDPETYTVGEIFTMVGDNLGAKQPFYTPELIKNFLLNLSGVSKRLKFFLKGRVYSLEHIKRVGFNPPYTTAESIAKTVNWFLNN